MDLRAKVMCDKVNVDISEEIQVPTTNISNGTTSNANYPPTNLGSRKAPDVSISGDTQLSSADNCNGTTSNTIMSSTIEGNTTPQDENVKSPSMSPITPNAGPSKKTKSSTTNLLMSKSSHETVKPPAESPSALTTRKSPSSDIFTNTSNNLNYCDENCISRSPKAYDPSSNHKSPPSMSSPTPMHERKSLSDDMAMDKRPQRKRKARFPVAVDEAVSIAEAMHPLTEEERKSWKGWVELESDPALFNFILRKYGVNGVKIQEVFSLEDEMLAFLPKPVYGLIFLFRYRDSDDEEEPEGLPVYPRNVWFANQTTNNACATVAMLNIVMNSPDVDLGGTLSRFKEDTKRLKPAYRGKRLGEHDFIRSVHNSFFRRMENLDADLSLQNDFEKWERFKNKPKRKTANNNRKKKIPDDDELAFHFIAYVPVDDVLWRLDGLQRQPLSLGDIGNNWIALARQSIEQRMAQYEEDGVQFNLLSLCKSPLQSIPSEAAVILRSLAAIEERLDELKPGWKKFASSDLFSGFDKTNKSFGLSEDDVREAALPQSSAKNIEVAGGNIETLLSLQQEELRQLARLQTAYMEEESAISHENTEVANRMVDHTQIVFNAVQTLLEAGVMKEIVQDVGKGGAPNKYPGS